MWLHVKRGGNAVVAHYTHPVEGYGDMADLKAWADTEQGWTQERVLRHVKVTRELVAAILARPHVLDDSEWYGCQAITHSYHDTHGNRFPEQDGRYMPTGRECACGRDEDVARLLGIIASEWEENP